MCTDLFLGFVARWGRERETLDKFFLPLLSMMIEQRRCSPWRWCPTANNRYRAQATSMLSSGCRLKFSTNRNLEEFFFLCVNVLFPSTCTPFTWDRALFFSQRSYRTVPTFLELFQMHWTCPVACAVQIITDRTSSPNKYPSYTIHTSIPYQFDVSSVDRHMCEYPRQPCARCIAVGATVYLWFLSRSTRGNKISVWPVCLFSWCMRTTFGIHVQSLRELTVEEHAVREEYGRSNASSLSLSRAHTHIQLTR